MQHSRFPRADGVSASRQSPHNLCTRNAHYHAWPPITSISPIAVCDCHTNWWPVEWVTFRTDSPFGIWKHHSKNPRTVGQICLQHSSLLLLRKEHCHSFYSFYNVYSIYSFSSLRNTKKVKKKKKPLRMRWLCSMMGDVKTANRILVHIAQMT